MPDYSGQPAHERNGKAIRVSLQWILGVALLLLCACGGNFHQPWREQKLPSGRTVKVTAFHLAWGIEHDERDPGKDSFDMEFVFQTPDAADEAREKEAKECLSSSARRRNCG